MEMTEIKCVDTLRCWCRCWGWMVWVMACIVRGDVCLDVLCNGG